MNLWKSVPSNVLARPKEIAQRFAYLINPKLHYLTDADVIMDRGVVANMEK